jgi:predicted dehydrogenase
MNRFRSSRSSRRRSTTLRIPAPRRFPVAVRRRHKSASVVRYAVVGLGHIAQVAVLPAFNHARRNSKLVALFSDDPVKRDELRRRYKVPIVAAYEDYDAVLKQGEIDAVYIALPNSMHCDFTIRAAGAGVHVLCEKPLALSERDCKQMIQACNRNRVKFMTAYRLHFEKSNLEAIKLLESGKLGEPRYFNSIFSMQAREPNIRLERETGGGPLWDLGVYCVNAARYLFAAEPLEVIGITASGKDKRFLEVEEMAAATLRFPGERVASFVCSFGAADTAVYEVVGTEGTMRLKNAYEYVAPIEMQLTIGDREKKRTFPTRDQFAAELLYFSDCILHGKDPEPSGQEGLADVRTIQAIYKSAKLGRRIKLPPFAKSKRPSTSQEIRRAPVRKPKLIHAQSGSR